MKRVCLITGASSGLGRACAERLQHKGWTIVGASRRGMSGDVWRGIVMDVDDDAAVAAGVAAVMSEHGRIDAVVTAAGWGLSGPVECTPIELAKSQFETNFWGSVRVVREVLPIMRAQRGGRIAVMGSIGGMIGLPYQAYYSASKFALEGFAEAVAYEVSPFGVSVTVIEPGNVATAFTANRRRRDPPDAASGYAGPNASAVATMEHDERNGITADQVAAVVDRVLASRRPPRRVTVGRVDERFGTVAKRLLPYRVFERLARSSLGV